LEQHIIGLDAHKDTIAVALAAIVAVERVGLQNSGVVRQVRLGMLPRSAVAQRVQRDPLSQTGGLDRRAAGGVQHRRIDRAVVIPARKQESPGPRQSPVGAKDAKQLRRQHYVAIFAALATTDQDHASRAVDVEHPQSRDIRRPSPAA
jgi:hypothetical protein